jgi:hypothetical protein
MADDNGVAISTEDLVRLMFRAERQTTTLGRALQQLIDADDTIEVEFPFQDDIARGDFVQFVMSELHSSYETIVLLAMKIDRLNERG